MIVTLNMTVRFKMFSILLVPLWAILYFHSPYLFVGFSAFFYFTQWHSDILNILVTFPLGLFYIQQQLKTGERPAHPNTLIWEFGRWIVYWILVWNDWGSQAQYLALSGYTYATAITLTMSTCDDTKLWEVKFRWYLIWTLWLVYKLLLDPTNLLMAIFLHSANFWIDFRLPDWS